MDTRSKLPPEDDDEDTIELELTAEEMRHLSHAANEAAAPAPVQVLESAPEPAVSPPLPAAATKRFRLWSLALTAALIGIVAAFVWRQGAPRRAAPRIAPPPAAAIVPAVASQPADVVADREPVQAQEQQRPPVRVRNPFDGNEVFEFPPGTTKAEARQKVSQVLLQRAVDRGNLTRGPAPAVKPRGKNN